jgi:glycosyltransferase involved in cell wall biosynthesis
MRGHAPKSTGEGLRWQTNLASNPPKPQAISYNQSTVLKYSIVVPLHNEQENVTDLYARLKSVMEANGESFEMILVDDGSIDGTFNLLREIAAVDSRVTVVKLRRNFGQTAGLAAGFDHARGEYVIAMDGDLQHDPADIPMFLEKIAEGYDIVSGWRKNRVDNFWLRRIPSRCANWLMAKLSGVDIHDFGTTFKAYRRDILTQVPLYGEMHRFIPALASWYGASIIEVPIKNVNRERGVSHYGISRTLRVFFDLLTIRFLLKYLSRPLHFFGTIGMVSIMSGFGVATYLGIEKLMHQTDVMTKHGPMMIFAAVLLLAGMNLLAVGLLGEMQVRYYHEPTQRPPYSVDRVLRAQSEESTISE